MSLDDIRKKIDTLDSKLLELLNERADLVHEVGEIKKKDGIEIYAPEREESLLTVSYTHLTLPTIYSV